MNESGRSVSALMRFFKVEPAQLLVVHDDLDFHRCVNEEGRRNGGTTDSDIGPRSTQGLLRCESGIAIRRHGPRRRLRDDKARRVEQDASPRLREQHRTHANLATTAAAERWRGCTPRATKRSAGRARSARSQKDRKQSLHAGIVGSPTSASHPLHQSPGGHRRREYLCTIEPKWGGEVPDRPEEASRMKAAQGDPARGIRQIAAWSPELQGEGLGTVLANIRETHAIANVVRASRRNV